MGRLREEKRKDMGARRELVVATTLLAGIAWLTIWCRETASKILNEYLASVGGKEAIIEAWNEKKATKKSKKRGRASTGAENGTNGSSKRGRKSGTHPATASPPASAEKAEFKPPTGSWEDAVVAIDACEGNEGAVVVYLTWQGGQKSQHPLPQVYKRCPQKVWIYYSRYYG